RAGGVLQMSPGSGLKDEFDEPLGELTELAGVAVAKVDKPGGDYREHYGIPHTAPRGELKLPAGPLWPECAFPLLGYAEEAAPAGAKVLASFADGKPAVFRRTVGKGTVLRFCFMPGLGYVKSANPPATSVITGYHPELLPLLTAALTVAKVARPVDVSEPLVEARRLTGAKADALVLVNWSGKELPGVTVTVRGAAAMKTAASTRGVRWQVTRKGRDLILRGKLAEAEVVVLRH
ncbi:MAG: hypothetical protein HYU66_16015, partial [Armatimonadetes bacterium]|nr:hypothetical protein [Armatimonadota bacterium]